MPDDVSRLVHAMPLEMSQDITDLAKALPKAQANLGDVVKKSENKHFQNRYADLSAVLDAIMPAFNDVGCCILQPTTFDGTMVVCQTIILHESGQWIRSTLSMKPQAVTPQGIGSCITYARRYALMALVGVAPEDDDGNAASIPVAEATQDRRTSQPPKIPSPNLSDEEAHRASKGERAYVKAKNTISACQSLDELDAFQDDNAEFFNRLDREWRDKILGLFKTKRGALIDVEQAAARTREEAY